MATVCLTFKTRCYSLDVFILWIKLVDYHHVPYTYKYTSYNRHVTLVLCTKLILNYSVSFAENPIVLFL